MNAPATARLAGFGVHIEPGPGEGAETLVMLHGWPDTHRLWDAQLPALTPHFRCVRLTLPGFGSGEPRRAVALAEFTAGLLQVIEAISPGRPVVLLVHDWGALFGYHFVMQHPERVSRLVGVDVGDAASREFIDGLGLRRTLMIFGYQAWLALAWGVGRFARGLADRMTRFMARALHCPTEPGTIHAGMNYPYHITWTGRHGGYRGMRPIEAPCPMLFVYGRRKPLHFHSRGWAERLASRPGCRVVPMEAGHWMMVSQPEAFNRIVTDWLLGR